LTRLDASVVVLPRLRDRRPSSPLSDHAHSRETSLLAATRRKVSECYHSSKVGSNAPSEDLDLHPVEDNQGSVSSTVQGGDVGRSPEEVGGDTEKGDEGNL
jgi:hypothetical protein